MVDFSEKDRFFMTEAISLARSALDEGEFPVGCVLVAGDRIVGKGARLSSVGPHPNELDHAEILAIREWASQRGEDAKYPVTTAYITLEPCLMCLGALIINGVDMVIYALEDVMGGAAGIDFSRPLTRIPPTGKKIPLDGHLYFDWGRKIRGGLMRREALALFQEFYSDPSNVYWKDSPLSRYILSCG